MSVETSINDSSTLK